MPLPEGIQRELLQAAVRTGVTPQLRRAKSWLIVWLDDKWPVSLRDIEDHMAKHYQRMDGTANLVDNTYETVYLRDSINLEPFED